MMRKMKKFLCAALTTTMVLAMAAPSFAAEGDPGKITIPNATIDQTYAAYKLFDANPNGDAIAYTATEAQKNALGADEDCPFIFTKNIAGTYNVTRKTDITDEDVLTYLNKFKDGISTNNLFTKEAEKKADSVEIEWNVPYGYYFVTSSLGTFVSINSTNKEVTIIDKNQSGPSWGDNGGKTIVTTDDEGNEKKVEQISANYGDTIQFEVLFDTTNYAGEKEIEAYYVSDNLAKGMSYVEDSFQVFVGSTPLIENESYTKTTTPAQGTEGQSFKITIPWKDNSGFKYDSPNSIKVTYSATVGSDAVIAENGNVNTAKFSYRAVGDGNETTSDTWKDTATTYTFALAINKTDKAGNGLSGATFTLTDASGVAVPVREETAGSGVYVYDKDGSNTTVVSPETGLIVIKGVEEDTYTLTETKAPEGYNVLTQSEKIEASIAKKAEYTTTTTVYYDEDGNVSTEETDTSATVITSVPVSVLTVVNFAGTMLPSTGGIGTTIFYAAGIILMAGAVFFVVRRKRA